MKKMVETIIRRCASLTLALVLVISVVNTGSYVTDVGWINIQSKATDSKSDTTPTTVKPKVAPTKGNVLAEDGLMYGVNPTTTGGGKALDIIFNSVIDKIKSLPQTDKGILKAQKQLARLLQGKANINKTLAGLKKGTKAFNQHSRYLKNKLARIDDAEGLLGKKFGSTLKSIKGLNYVGSALSIYGIYSDSEALWKGDYKHKHSSMRFVRDSLLGSNVAINSFLLTPYGQLPIMKQGAEGIALTLGFAKDFVTSDRFAAFMNKQDNYVLRASNDVITTTNEFWTDAFTEWIIDWNQYTGDYPSDEELKKIHEKWLEYKKKKGLGRKPGDNVGVYKPNIYLYPEDETNVTVTFNIPGLLEEVIPEYTGEWLVTAYSDGTIIGADNETYTYLFYESMTWPFLYQTDEGWFIEADNRSEQMERIMVSYGFTEQETADFIEYWTVKLEEGTDYAMYPQLISIVDIAMPMTIEPQPDSIFRLWFAFEQNVTPSVMPSYEPIVRDGFSVVEWGGIILP